MPESLDREWRELCATYAAMCDEELLQLAEDFDNLREIAQLTLRDEMKARGLSAAPRLEPVVPSLVSRKPTRGFEPPVPQRRPDPLFGTPPPEAVLTEYTWKVPLCEYETLAGAVQLSLALERAGLDSWVVESHPPQVLVASDQLTAAKAVLAQPVPPDITEQLTVETPEYEPPKCPSCGAEEPVLESANPVNQWSCESCGRTWADAPPE